MFTSRYLNNALSSIHEQTSRLIYNNDKLPFNRILDKNRPKSIQQKNIESIFFSEIYKFENSSVPPIMSHSFVTKENKYFQALQSSIKWTATFGRETIFCRGPWTWNLNPEDLRALATLNKFKKETKMCNECECRMYIRLVGFIN